MRYRFILKFSIRLCQPRVTLSAQGFHVHSD